jgi:hypothetical protein
MLSFFGGHGGSCEVDECVRGYNVDVCNGSCEVDRCVGGCDIDTCGSGHDLTDTMVAMRSMVVMAAVRLVDILTLIWKVLII